MKELVKNELNNIMENLHWDVMIQVDWNFISMNQKLSDDFIREFRNKLNLKFMLKWNYISQKFYNELKYGKPKLRCELLDFS